MSDRYIPIYTPVTLPTSAGDSGAIDVRGKTITGFQTPATLASVSLTFKASYDGVTFCDLRDETNALITLPVTTSDSIMLGQKAPYFDGIFYLKLTTSVTEAASTIVQVLFKEGI